MRFEFVAHASLPRLAWCAHVRRSEAIVDIHHGPWVETAADWFVEGAWTGSFSAGGHVEAGHLVGTGGRAERDQVVFCAPTNLLDRLYSIRDADDLYVSNSVAFVLSISGNTPDPHYTEYAVDRLQQQAWGLRRVGKLIRTAKGPPIAVHDFCNLCVRPDLSLRVIEKPALPPPGDYSECVKQIDDTIAGLQANAADPNRRRQRYRPVATISRGYDAGVLAVLMRRHGAKEAIAFSPPIDDDGTEIAEQLGYTVTKYARLEYKQAGGMPEAEFLVTPWGTDLPMAACERQLGGAIFATGRRGGRIFTMRRAEPPGLVDPRLSALSGTTLLEFRLRVGCLHMAPYFVTAMHPEAVRRITVSGEMKPWSIGGTYDRPILRRILEEAGIPRESFGQVKRMAPGFMVKSSRDLTPEGAADFKAFNETMPAIPWHRHAIHDGLVFVHGLAIWANRKRRRLYAILGRPLPPKAPGQQLRVVVRRPPVAMAYAFHWACARVQPRYTLDSTALRETRPDSKDAGDRLGGVT